MVEGGVGYEHEATLLNGVVAEGDVAGCLLHVDPEGSFEPLAVLVDKSEQAGWGFAEGGGELNQFVELRLGVGVEDVEAMKRSEAVRFGDAKLEAGCEDVLGRNGGVFVKHG